VLVDDFYRRYARRRERDPISAKALDLDPEPVAIRDDEAEVTDLRNVDARVVDLVQDAVADGEPHP